MSWLEQSVGKDIDERLVPGYSLGGVSGVMAAGLAANSEIFQFRFNDSLAADVLNNATGGSTQPYKAAITSVIISAAVDITGFTAGAGFFQLLKSTAWTVSGTGGTALTPVTHDGKKNTLLPTSKVADMRIASTVALGAGTKTLDAQALGTLAIACGAAGTLMTFPYELLGTDFSEDMLVLGQNEGFSIVASVPLVGVWKFAVMISWDEVPGSLNI